MPQHVIVDGSNLATEGRSVPSLKQLNEAVMAYMADHPTALITVVVDATFGHRIDSAEVAEFDEAVANNELVAPPAGAIGRGDAFVLSIANKVNATIISNDSFQEFHGQYDWLFDEGRLVGGKPVPHVGWVFVDRLPVRGPTSRKAVKESKRKSDGAPSRSGRVSKASAAASAPLPVPTSPPPGARLGKTDRSKAGAPKTEPATAKATTGPAPASGRAAADSGKGSVGATNDLMAFLTFVEHHPPGTSVNALVESYSSHGAYVSIGEVRGYVPLRLMADPAPRSAREFMKVGESITLVVESFGASRRSIDLAVPTMATVHLETDGKKAARKKAARQAAGSLSDPATATSAPKQPAPRKRSGKKQDSTPSTDAPETTSAVPVEKAASKPAATKEPAAKRAAAAKTAPSGAAAKKAPAAKARAAKVPVERASAAPAKKAPAKKAPAKKAPAKKAPAKKAPAKKAPAAAGATEAASPAPSAAKRRRPSSA
jgi:hypothetical protein